MNYIEDLEVQITKTNHKGLNGWQSEFNKIKDPKISTQYASKFMDKNRYSNILPYDHNRVQISDYINASWVNNDIATQWPKPNTLNDFWEMLFTHNINTIIALNNIERDDQVIYWESENVNIISIIYKEDFIIRTLQVTFQNTTKLITHYQYTAWPDFKCPNIVSLLNMIDMLNDDVKCIHCSAGVGRTGTFMTINDCINKINNCESFNIVETIKLLRSQRLSMVQTKEQFAFCYYALLYYLKL